MRQQVYVVECRISNDEWEPREAHVDKRDALLALQECRPEGGQWRVTTYTPKKKT